MLKVFIDESGNGTPPIFVLSGLVSTAAAWAIFVDEWADALKADPPLTHYKSTEFMRFDPWRDVRSKEKFQRLHILQSIINKHVNYVFTVSLPQVSFKEIFDSNLPKIARSPYFFAATGMIENILRYECRLGRKELVDFVFDEQLHEQEAVQKAWNDAKSGPVPAKLRRRMGSITWGDDSRILPLQAADMLAWLTRRLAADMIGDAGTVYPGAKGRPLYDISILQEGLSAEDIRTPAGAHALALRLSSKSWPLWASLSVPIIHAHIGHGRLLALRDVMVQAGLMKLPAR